MDSSGNIGQSPRQEISDGVVSEIHAPQDDVYSTNNTVGSLEVEYKASIYITNVGKEMKLDRSGRCVQF